MAPPMAMSRISGSRPPSSPRPVSVGAALGAGVGTGVALAAGVETSVTTTCTAVFGLPFVITGTPAALRQVAFESPTSAVTT